MDKPLISVITVCFNAAEEIEYTINSILNQDFDGFDILVPYELYEKAYDTAVGIGAIKLEGEEILEEEPELPEPHPIEEMSRSKRTTVKVISKIFLPCIFLIMC